ncbi:MAG: DUF4252 domain-containing protein, partial [Acidobacteriaceae bacterium]|nr:DUF4252 domain-containing protein [Acidobacteriaceae bacterium]
MKQLGILGFIGIILTAPAWSQEVKMPVSLDRLAKIAKETVNVNLDSSMLQLGSGFLSKSDPDEAKLKDIVSKLRGVYVRSFEFEKEGQYSKSDVEMVRSQLTNWSRIVSVTGKEDNTEVYVKKKGDQFDGLFVIDAEPTELTFVNIEGPINPKDLGELSGEMGIPNLGSLHSHKDKGNTDK